MTSRHAHKQHKQPKRTRRGRKCQERRSRLGRPQGQGILAQVRSGSPYAHIVLKQTQLDSFSVPELGDLCRKHDIHVPDTDDEVEEPQQFSLVFASSIGLTGRHSRYVFQVVLVHMLMLLDRYCVLQLCCLSLCNDRFATMSDPGRPGYYLRVPESTICEIERYFDTTANAMRGSWNAGTSSSHCLCDRGGR